MYCVCVCVLYVCLCVCVLFHVMYVLYVLCVWYIYERPFSLFLSLSLSYVGVCVYVCGHEAVCAGVGECSRVRLISFECGCHHIIVWIDVFVYVGVWECVIV